MECLQQDRIEMMHDKMLSLLYYYYYYYFCAQDISDTEGEEKN